MRGKTTWISLGIFIAALVIVGVLITSRQNMTPDVSGSPTPAGTQAESGDLEEEENLSEVTIEGKEFLFTPSTSTVKTGVISITFENAGTMEHDLVFEDIDAATQTLSPGESETIEFIVEEPGTYTFYCSVSGHRLLGMEGELVVE